MDIYGDLVKTLVNGNIDFKGVSHAIHKMFNEEDDQNDEIIDGMNRIGRSLVASAPLIGEILGVTMSTSLKVLLNNLANTLHSYIVRTFLLGTFFFGILPLIKGVLDFLEIFDKLDLYSENKSQGEETDELLTMKTDGLLEHIMWEVYKAIDKFNDIDVDRVVFG